MLRSWRYSSVAAAGTINVSGDGSERPRRATGEAGGGRHENSTRTEESKARKEGQYQTCSRESDGPWQHMHGSICWNRRAVAHAPMSKRKT
eukprot:2217587-Pyramimonas_sp.AAC.1